MDENKLKKLIIGFGGLAAGLLCFLMYRSLSYISAYILNKAGAYSSSLVIIIAGILTIAITIAILLYNTSENTSGQTKWKNLEYLGMKKIKPSYIGSGIICGLALNMMTVSLVSIIPMPESWIEANQKSTEMLADCPIWITIVATYIVAPAVEELIFRGFLYKAVRNGWGIAIPLIMSSLIFGIAHGNILQGIYAFIAGAFFAFLLEITGSFWTTLAGHMAYNFGNIISSIIFQITGKMPLFFLGILFLAGGLFLTFYSKHNKIDRS